MAVLGLAAGWGLVAGAAAALPANDNFANATVLTGGFGSTNGDNSFASAERGEPAHAGFTANASLWYQWRAPADGEMTMDTLSTADPSGQLYLDTVLAVYTGSDVSHLTQVAANDDQFPIQMEKVTGLDPNNNYGGYSLNLFPTGPSLVRFTAVSNTVYYVALDSKPGYRGNLAFNWAYHSSGVFRWASEQFGSSSNQFVFRGNRFSSLSSQPLYLCSSWETLPDSDTTWQTYYQYGVPGVLVTVTRLGGATGRVLVDYATQDGTGTNGAYAGTNYMAVSGTLAFDDQEMTKSIVVPIIEETLNFRGFFGTNSPLQNNAWDFNVVLSNPRLDAGESQAVSPPRLDPVMTNAIVRILSLYAPDARATNTFFGGYDPDLFFVGTTTPTHDYFNFQRVHYTVTRDVTNTYTTVVLWVLRWPNMFSTTADSATINYSINNFSPTSEVDEELNNEFALQPGSDYAIPSPPIIQGLLAPSNSDFVLAEGSVSIPDTSGGATISFTIPNDKITRFNKDFHVYLWRDINGARTLPGIVNEAVVTILFDDLSPPAGSVDQFYNPDHSFDMVNHLPVISDPPDIGQPGADGQVMSLLVLTNISYFTNIVVVTNNGVVVTNEVTTTQSYDETIIAGDFASYDTHRRNRIALISNGGFVDGSFDPGDGPNGFVSSLAFGGNGGYLLGGAFSSYQSKPRNGVALITSSGALDTSFNPGFGANGTVRSIVALPNGQYLIAGDFTTFNLTNSSHIARINADGSLDAAFSANLPTIAGQSIYSLAVNGAGRIYVGGAFSSVGGLTLANLACLNSDGTLNVNFANNISPGPNGSVYSVAVDPSGRVLVGGAFYTIGAVSRTRVARLNSNGSMDYSFDPGTGPDDTVYSIAPQTDGTIYVSGQFLSCNGTQRLGLVRLFHDGTVDTGFMDTAFNQFAGLHRYRFSDPVGVVLCSAVQSDGNVMIGGAFSQVGGGQADPNIRLNPNNTILDSANVLVEYDYTNNVWMEPKARDGVRNRLNLARLIGGSTAGPGNLGLTFTNYNVNKSQGAFSVTMNRTNGNLGYLSANLSVLPNVAQSGVDYNYFASPPIYQTSWRVLYQSSSPGSTSRQYEDGMYGTNLFPNNAWGDYYYQYTPGRVVVNTVRNTLGGDRQAQFQLANPGGADQFFLGGANIPIRGALGRAAAPFTVVDDSHAIGTIGFSQPTYTVNEGTNLATINVSRTNGAYGQVAVFFATTAATSSNVVIGTDYWPTNGTLTFQAGVTNMAFSVPIIANTLIQPQDRLVGLTLSSSTLGVIGLSNATLSIIDDNYPLGYVKFDSASYVTNESAGALVATVTRVGSSRGFISVLCNSTNNGTAKPNIDYVNISTNLTWASGDASSRSVVLPLLDNHTVGPDTTLGLVLSNPIGYNTNAPTILAGSRSSAAVTIHNDNLYGTLQFSAAKYTVNENGGYATLTVIRTGGAAQSLSVNYATADGPNTFYQGEGILPNYVAVSGTLVFQPNQTAASFNVPVLDDGVVDPTTGFYFTVSLSGLTPAGAALGAPATAVVSLVDAQAVYAPAGAADPNFAPSAPGFNGDILSLQVQTNGQVVVGGNFTTASGVSRSRIARVNVDGTLDPVYMSGQSGADASINAVLVQSDGNAVIGGAFTTINGLSRTRIARLLADGSADASFDPGSGSDGPIYALAESFKAGGTVRQLLIGGGFSSFNSISHSSLLRINSDGGIDATFNPALNSGCTVYALAVYPSTTLNAGKVLIGGDFTTVNGYPRNGIARLNADGTLDTSFDAGAGATNAVRTLALQMDGRIVVGGSFTNFAGVSFNHLVRLNVDGTVDAGFNVGVGADDTVDALAIQGDNRILVGGAFTRANGVSRSHITRLLPDGTVDPSINFGLGADGYINTVVIQPNGMFVVGGGFTHYDGQDRSHLARIFGGSMAGAGAMSFLSANFQADENSTNAFITIRRTGGTAGAAVIQFDTSNGSGTNAARSGVNYSNVSTTLTFPNGETLQTVVVPVIEDFQITPDLQVNLTLSNPAGGAVLGDQYKSLLTIYNDDSSISFAATDFAFNQNVPSESALIHLTRNGSTRFPAAINFYTTTNGTAVAGADYTAVSNTVPFLAGATNANVFVPLINNPAMLDDTTVVMRLTNVVNSLAFNPVQATLTILSTNASPGQIYFQQTNYVLNKDAGFVAVTVSRTNGHAPFTVSFATLSGTNVNSAVAGVDYAATNGVLTFADREYSKTIYVPLLNSPQIEGTRVFDVALSNLSQGGSFLGPNVAEVDLLDVVQGIGFRNAVYVVSEAAGQVILTLDRTVTNQTNTVEYSTADGTATAGVNYVTNFGLLTFIPGEVTKTLSLSVLHDPRVTGSLSFNVNLTDITNAHSAPALLYPHASALVNVLDIDPGISFSTNSYGALKSGTNVLISVLRSNANSGVVSVNFTTVNGTGPYGAIAGQDYYQTNGTLFFSNGIALQTFTVPIINNHIIQSNRTFQVTLSTNFATLGAPQLLMPTNASVTITDNVAGLSFQSPVYQVNENGNHALISVIRSGYTNCSVTVNYTTVTGSNSDSAVIGVNYLPTNGTLLFTNGETLKTFSVPVLDDSKVDGDHILQLSLSNPAITNSLNSSALLTAPNSANLTISETDGSLILSAGAALTYTQKFTNSNPVNLGTSAGAKSLIWVTNVPSQVEKVVVHVPSATTPLAQDLALMLAGPSGSNVGLMANAGTAAPLAAASLSFDDWAASALPQASVITNGAYMPTIFGSLPSFGLSPAPAYSTNLGSFADSLPNGYWALYAADAAAGSLASGWSMDLTCLETNASRLIQPGDTVTMLFGFRNGGGLEVTNLMATLLPTGGVTNPIPSGPQSYGPLAKNGPSTSRLFTFTAAGTNGQLIAVEFQLQDGTNANAATYDVVFNFVLGASTVIFSNTVPIHIPLIGSAAPYPSQIAVSGVGNMVTKVTATLTNLAHTYPSDIDILLTSPAGQESYLMAKAGGSRSITNVTVTFDDAATTLLPKGLITNGAYKPTCYAVATPPFPPTTTPVGPYLTNMTTFTGNNPNGIWSLYVLDDTALNSGIISNGWYLTLTTSSPVGTAADVGVAVAASEESVIVLSNVTYTVMVENYGPGVASNVVVTVTNIVPAGSAFAAPGGAVSTNALGQLVWNVGALLKGAQASLPVTVWPNAMGSAVLTAAVASTTSDPNAADDQAAATVAVVAPTADLVLTLASAPNSVPLDSDYTLTATINNYGPATAVGVSLALTLDPSVTLVSTMPTNSSLVNGALTFANLGDLGSNSFTTATVVVRSTASGVINAYATCASSVPGPKADRDGSVKTLVLGALQLQFQTSGGNLLLSWPASMGLYNLQYATNLVSPVTWVTLTNAPVLEGGNYTYTNAIGTGSEFFRLISPNP